MWQPWEPTSQPAFMVSKAAGAAVWEDLKNIMTPLYDGILSTSTASSKSCTIKR